MLRLSPLELGQRVKPYFEQAGLWRDDLLADSTALFDWVWQSFSW